MKLPRVRFTVQRMMVVVLVVAALLWAKQMFDRHLLFSGISRFYFYKMSEETFDLLPPGPSDSQEAADLTRRLRNHYLRLGEKYERAAWAPWSSVPTDPPLPTLAEPPKPAAPAVDFLPTLATSTSPVVGGEVPADPALPPTPRARKSNPVATEGGRVLLTQRRAEVERLEAEWAAQRAEVEKHLADIATVSAAEIKDAEASSKQAKLSREIAEVAVAEYDEIYKMDREMVLGEIALAESRLGMAADRASFAEQRRKDGRISENQFFDEKLRAQKARFDVEQLRMKLQVLETYTKQKEVRNLVEAAEKARTEEVEALARLELLKVKAEAQRGRAGRVERLRDPSLRTAGRSHGDSGEGDRLARKPSARRRDGRRGPDP